MSMLSHDALIVARQVYGRIRVANQLTIRGDHEKARAVLAEIASIVEAQIPVIDHVIAAQTKAAEALDLTQHTPFGRLPLRERPAPNLTAANDEHPTTSEQPGGTVA